MDFWLILALAAQPPELPAIAESLAYVRGTGRREILRWGAPLPPQQPKQWTA